MGGGGNCYLLLIYLKVLTLQMTLMVHAIVA